MRHLPAVAQATDLRRIAQNLMAIANEIESTIPGVNRYISDDDDSFPRFPPAIAAKFALAVRAARVRRDRHFPDKLFGEPAWDILLELFASTVMGERISIDKACRAANVAQTTALRYIRELERHGLIAETPGLADSGVALLEMTEKGLKAMRATLREQVASERDVYGDRFRSDSILLGEGDSGAASGNG